MVFDIKSQVISIDFERIAFDLGGGDFHILLAVAGRTHVNVIGFTSIAEASHIWGFPEFGILHYLMAEHTVSIGSFHEKTTRFLKRWQA